MSVPHHDPSIDAEPHLRQQIFHPDESERTAERLDADRGPIPLNEQVEQSVWDEPGLSPELSGGMPADALTYERWLEFRRRQITPQDAWLTTIVVALLAGPWALLGALFAAGGGATAFGVVMVTIVGPVTEEMMKAALPLWIVEKRPFRFRSALQIAICLIVSGLVFAAVENVLYLFAYIDNPSPDLIRWRWTVCLALHTGCSFIAGMGLIRIWQHTMITRTPPQLALGAPYMVTAIVIHGVYNTFCVLLDATGFQF